MQGHRKITRKKICLEEIERFYHVETYYELVSLIQRLILEGTLTPIKSSRSNGKQPPLAQRYWITVKEEENPTLLQELTYELHPALQNTYYLQHLKQYEIDRSFVLAVNQFWKENQHLLKIEVSLNERSFQIWQAEKFLKEGEGQRILKNLGLSFDDLHLYQTSEPLSYYAHYKTTPQNIIIVENKDTFYSMRRHLLAGQKTILELPVGTLIYGGGKKIQRTIADFEICVEPYLTTAGNHFYYFGDLDYEGIGIFQTLQRNLQGKQTLQLFTAAYRLMLQKAEGKSLPFTKEGQTEIPIQSFLSSFSVEEQKTIQRILKARQYIPQEILTMADF